MYDKNIQSILPLPGDFEHNFSSNQTYIAKLIWGTKTLQRGTYMYMWYVTVSLIVHNKLTMN